MEPFHLERYFARYEFSARYLLSSSDCDGLRLDDLLGMADAQTARLWRDLTLGYTDSLGHPLLREEIASLYQTIQPAQVLTVVPEEGIFLAMRAILAPGDHVICAFPGYQSLYSIAEDLGCEVTRWTPDEANRWRFDPQFLQDHIRPTTRLIVINFPHNPTGAMPSQAEYHAIVEIARQHGIMLFSDEMYRFLEYDAADRLPAACDLYENALSLFGMSKTFGLAGLRSGWLATRHREIYQKMALLKDYTTICGSAPAEILSIIALRAKEVIIARHLARIRRNLGLVTDFLARYPHLFTLNPPRAGTVAFPRLNGGRSAEQFCQTLVEQANIMLLPSTVYGFGDAHVRIGLGRENLPEVLERFADFLQTPGDEEKS